MSIPEGYVPSMYESDAYDAGYEAFWDHVEEYQCPYKTYTPEALDWERGWNDAQYDKHFEQDADDDEFDDADGDYDADDEDTE